MRSQGVAEARKAGLRVWSHLAVDPLKPSELVDAGVEVGKLADLVLLSQDPLADVANTQTVVGVRQGRRCFPREASMRAIPKARPPRAGGR